jgi:hypothetical protein
MKDKSMKFKLPFLFIVFSLIISLPIAQIFPVYADDGEQPTEKQNIIDVGLQQYLKRASPNEIIRLIVKLNVDTRMPQQILAIYDGEPNDELHNIIRRGLGVDNMRVKDLVEARAQQVASMLTSTYSSLQQEIVQKIKQLADTEVYTPNVSGYSVFQRADIVNYTSIYVITKVGYVEDIAAIPGVAKIDRWPNSETYWWIIQVSPSHNCPGCPINGLLFIWEPYKEFTGYKLVLAKDAAMTEVVKEAEIPFNAYEYDGILDYSSSYYWRVMAVKPGLSDWSGTFAFQTEAEPTPPVAAWSRPGSWPPALIVVIITVLAAGTGLVTWLLIIRRHKAK